MTPVPDKKEDVGGLHEATEWGEVEIGFVLSPAHLSGSVVGIHCCDLKGFLTGAPSATFVPFCVSV